MDDVMRLMLERSSPRGFTGRDVERAVEDVCGCDVTSLFAAHVRRGGQELDFDRYLALIGLRAQVASAPAVFNGQPERDLRIFGWEPPGERGVRLIINHPGSIWSRAGLASGDRLVSVNGTAVATWPEFPRRAAAAANRRHHPARGAPARWAVSDHGDGDGIRTTSGSHRGARGGDGAAAGAASPMAARGAFCTTSLALTPWPVTATALTSENYSCKSTPVEQP